jgi:hypothetical protein
MAPPERGRRGHGGEERHQREEPLHQREARLEVRGRAAVARAAPALHGAHEEDDADPGEERDPEHDAGTGEAHARGMPDWTRRRQPTGRRAGIRKARQGTRSGN